MAVDIKSNKSRGTGFPKSKILRTTEKKEKKMTKRNPGNKITPSPSLPVCRQGRQKGETEMVLQEQKKIEENEKFNKQIASRIKNARNLLGFTQEKTAKKAGISLAFLERIEKGISTVNIKTLVKIAKALNVDIPDLLPAKTKFSKNAGFKPLAKLFQNMSAGDKEITLKLARIICDSK
jgi:transcriptional regulator with XRE-family HTH domain